MHFIEQATDQVYIFSVDLGQRSILNRGCVCSERTATPDEQAQFS
jgi:hypothetical protein